MLSSSPFKSKRWEMDMVSCCRILGIRSFVLEVRSWSSNNVPINLYQINVILCPDEKEQSPKARLCPSKVPALAERRQSSAGSSFRARFPRPAQLSSPREPRAQPSWPSGSSGYPDGGDQVSQTVTRTAIAGSLQRQACARGSPLPQGLGLG